MVFINGFIVISLCAILAYFYGFLLFLSDFEENKCEMTYMFEYPQFVRISMQVNNNLRKYRLYSYSEGQLTEKARKMQFNGIPVLFIPGNAGSYKQVRSLASVALRKSLNSRSPVHFDYFTIDFNEELSGLNGALLYDQVEFANESIYRILKLYASSTVQPTSVVLIGHSMGGIIAEALLSSLTSSNTISLVITLASPHKRPPLLFDIHLQNYYKDIESWNNKMNTTFVSIFGGFNDFLVPSHLTSSKHLGVVTTHIPKTWLSMDHLCILWCKQLVLVLNRALFDSVDLKTKQVSTDKEYVTSIFKHYLLHNSGTKINLKGSNDLYTPIDNRGNWVEYLPRQYSVNSTLVAKQTQWYMVRLTNHPLHEVLSVVALNLEVANWIYVCSATEIKEQSRTCVDGKHLSHLSEIIPSSKYKRRFLNINLHELSGNFTHVVVKVPPMSEPVTLHVDVHSAAGRKFVVNLPFSSFFTFKNKIIIEETDENSLYYELHFPTLEHAIQSYQLFVEPVQCKLPTHHATATLSVPWSNLNYHVIFTEDQNMPMNLRLYTSRPTNMANSTATVKLILDPNCKYSVSVKPSIPNILGQFARFYSPLILVNVAAVILLVLKSQLHNIGNKQRCSLFFTALMTDTKPYYVVPIAKLLVVILSSSVILKILPITDIQVLNEEGLGVMPTIFLYLLSIGVVWILAMGLAISLFCFETTIHNITLSVLSKSVIGTTTTYDWLLKSLKKFPAFVALLLIVVSISTCGGLALCLGLIFYFLKLTQMAQDVVENIVMKFIKVIARKLKVPQRLQQKIQKLMIRNAHRETVTDKSVMDDKKSAVDGDSTSKNESTSREELIPEAKRKAEEVGFFEIFQEIAENNELYFHFTIFCLWFLVTCINIPTVLIWAHNFKYSSKLESDPSCIVSLMLCACGLALWQLEFPIIEKKWYNQLGYLIHALLIFSYIYGAFSVYRLNYALASVVVLVTLHQLLAPKKEDVAETDNSQRDGNYDKLKAKWE